MGPVTDADAAAAGVDAKATVRAGIIEVRNEMLKFDSPPWEYVTLFSHAIWWLADEPGQS